ncbi:MAG: glycosyltransferase family 9 protein [Chthoniobacteraceae bacterium]
MKRKILIVELWGLGDLTFATPVIAAALKHDEVHLVGKAHAVQLLQPSFPGIRFFTYEAPWTAYLGKYNLWKWKWLELLGVILCLRREKYDLVISVRNDPRNHFFMWLVGGSQRVSFILEGIRRFLDTDRIFLTRRLKRRNSKQHKVEDWQQLGAGIGLPVDSSVGTELDHPGYRTDRVDAIFAGLDKPVICLHAGARIAVRRWPEAYFVRVVEHLRENFDFHLIVIPEPHTDSSRLAEVADSFITDLTVRELVDLIGRVDLLLCNDSAPGHIAACLDRPSVTIFGPSDPDWFRPWGHGHQVIIRDICPWRPCFDYCKFSEPHCMTKLMPQTVWPEIEQHMRSLIASCGLTDVFLKSEAPIALACA